MVDMNFLFDTSKTTFTPKKIEVLTLLPEKHPKIYFVPEKYIFSNLMEAEYISLQLVETVKHHNAYGLSANQTKELWKYNVCVAGTKDEYVAMFNPVILESSIELVNDYEGCLSFPALLVPVKRSKTVLVEYQDFRGKFHKVKLDNLMARVVQHELDHLKGITFDQKVGKVTLQIAKKRREKELNHHMLSNQ